MATCLPGLQGFPIQVTGWQSEPEKEKYIIPNDISIQFSPNQIPVQIHNGSFTINGTNTFFMGGNQYFVKNIRLCQAKQSGLTTKSASPLAELHFWGLPTATSQTKAQNTIALLNIPIFQDVVESSSGTSLISALKGKAIRIEDFIPKSSDTDVIRYSTCVETDKSSSLTIVIGYWSNGMSILQENVKVLPSPVGVFGVPDILNYKLLSSYILTQGETGQGGKGQRDYKVNGGILQPYSNTVVLSVNTPDFTQRFRMIRGFQQETTSSKLETSGYKCVAIDRSRDIKNGKLLIDPSSGKKLSDEVDDASAENDNQVQPATITPRQILDVVFTILGVILGFALLGGLIYVISYMFLTRKSLGLPPVNPATEALATRLGPQVGD